MPYPKEVVTDYFLSLLNAVSLAFNDMTIKAYVDNYMKMTMSANEYSPFKCIIRMDIAHIIRLICRWKCFQNQHSRLKDFYVRCIDLVIKCLDMRTCCDIFRDTESTSDSNVCFASQNRLLKAIKNDVDNYPEDNMHENHIVYEDESN